MEKMKLRKKILYSTLFCTFFMLFTTPLTLQCEEEGEKVFNKKYNSIIHSIARRYRIPSLLIQSIIYAESHYNHRAVSPKGAQGLMQLMPETAKRYGVKNVFDPMENIEGGVKYLKDLMENFNSHTNLVLAAYNAGEIAVDKHNGIPPYPETINFIQNVKKFYNKPYITTSTPIFTFYNESGRLVITDNPRLKAISGSN